MPYKLLLPSVSKLSTLSNAWAPSVWCVLCPWDHQQHFPQCGVAVAEHRPLLMLELSMPESNCSGKKAV